MVCLLSAGDITKRDAILWGFTLKECGPYLKERQRDALFREAILAYLGVKDEKNDAEDYCRACKLAGKDDDCEGCDRRLNVGS